MIVQFFDRTQTTVTKHQAQQIAVAINKGTAMIQINGMMVNPKSIAMIRPGGETEADIIPRDKRLAAPDYRGKPSPALEKLRERWGRNVPPSEQEAA